MNSEIIKNLEQKLKALVERCKSELSVIRTNRPNAQLVEDLTVNYFDQPLPLKQLASINVVLPRTIDISVWDKNALAGVVKAIENSPLGVVANVDGQVIHVNLPPLTAERRQELVRVVKKMIEEVRVRIRSIRDESNREIGRLADDNKVSEDQKFKLKEDVQEIVDKTNKELDNLLQRKIKEIEE